MDAKRSQASDPSPAHLNPNAPRPTQPKSPARIMYLLHHLLTPNPIWEAVAVALESNPLAYRAFTAAEKLTKGSTFGCRMCAQCVIPDTGYACPMTCPKQLRNGPCGGVRMDGGCEVYPEMKCVWLIAYERAEEADKIGELRRLQRPIDQRKWGQSSWVNYWRHRDDRLAESLGPRLEGAPELNVHTDGG